MSNPNKPLQVLLIHPPSGRAPVITRREFLSESIILNYKDGLWASQLNMSKEKPCCQNATNPPKHLKPTLCWPFIAPFFSFFKQENVDRNRLVNAHCAQSHGDRVILEPNIHRKEKNAGILLCPTTQKPNTLQLPQSKGSQRFIFFPTEHGVINSIKFLFRQEGIKMNLEQKELEILFPLYSAQGMPKISWKPGNKGKKWHLKRQGDYAPGKGKKRLQLAPRDWRTF